MIKEVGRRSGHIRVFQRQQNQMLKVGKDIGFFFLFWSFRRSIEALIETYQEKKHIFQSVFHFYFSKIFHHHRITNHIIMFILYLLLYMILFSSLCFFPHFFVSDRAVSVNEKLRCYNTVLIIRETINHNDGLSLLFLKSQFNFLTYNNCDNYLNNYTILSANQLE